MNTFASKIIFPGILPEKGKFSSEESFSIEDWHQAVDHFDQNLHFCASSKVMLKKQEVQNQNLLLLILEALSPEAEKPSMHCGLIFRETIDKLTEEK